MAKDKSIIQVSLSGNLSGGTGSYDTGLLPQSYVLGAAGIAQAQTVSGLRWEITFAPTATITGTQFIKWCIWVRRKLQAVPPFTSAQAGGVGDAFASIDENNVLVWGTELLTPSINVAEAQGATKTQRKMQVGDQLVFSVRVSGAGAETFAYNGIIQTFFKS